MIELKTISFFLNSSFYKNNSKSSKFKDRFIINIAVNNKIYIVFNCFIDRFVMIFTNFNFWILFAITISKTSR